MASSEVMESPGMVDSSFYVELSAPEGWSKKVEPRMAGTPKRKGVVYVAPNGEKIRNKRQLEKYLKVHQGGLSSADFDWSTGATPRRSARLSSKGRQSSDSTEVEPAPKRPKVNGDEEATVLVSTRKSSRKKSSSDAVVTKDEAMEGAENRENEKRAVADDVVVSPDVVEKVAPIGNESLEEITATAEKHEAEELAVTTGGIELGDHAEQVPSTEELPSVGHSEVKERRGCGRGKRRGLRNFDETNKISSKCLLGNGSSVPKVANLTWDPTDLSHVQAVKTTLHLSAVPDTILCRELEQRTVMSFCQRCIMEQKAGTIYICGCPGTGKSLTIEKVKQLCAAWSEEANTLHPETVTIKCNSLTDPRHIYARILQAIKPGHASDDFNRDIDLVISELKERICRSKHSNSKSSKKMLLLVVDEMDYLITRDQSVLYELFRLSTFTHSRLVLIGIANAIDLTERLLPNLRSMNCRVAVITFPAYTKDQILAVLQQRLRGLPYAVFQPAALELCARKVAAATGDMRKALHVCRSAVELVEAEALGTPENECETLKESPSCGEKSGKNSGQDPVLVRIHTMAKVLSRIFRSPVVETIQDLPRHQQMVLCAAVRRFRSGKKDCNLGELNAGYLEFCKATEMQALKASEFSSICQVLADQALFNLGTSREDRLRRVTLKVDEEDVTFALQGIRFFRNNLQ